MRGLMGRVGMVAAALWVVFHAGEARAQYRNNGIYFEGGVQTYEFLPYTVAAFASSRAVYETATQVEKAGGPARPNFVRHCGQMKPYGFPCVNNWFGLTDGPYFGLGYQRVIGDLLVDVSESPLIKNIVFNYGARLGGALTLAGGGHMAPVFIVHQDFGIRWNILDERIRPYVGAGFGFNLFVDPFGLAGRVRANNAQCASGAGSTNAGTPGYVQSGGEGCIATPTGGDVSISALGPSVSSGAALFYITSFPVLLTFPRPEVGLEYFFMEDISVQGYLSPAVYFTLLPQFLFRPPLAGLSLRGGANVVFYF
ncbi:MAG: hypothetical protein HY904_22320 [Deltaproteobacteria bacterium]|nr:hypothetical protein [Deltaproteobacteria bacterium]